MTPCVVIGGRTGKMLKKNGIIVNSLMEIEKERETKLKSARIENGFYNIIDLVGNTVVLKPSPFTPLTVLRISDYIRELLPPGVLNTVTGGDELGPWMTSHPGIDHISFTGSTETGKRVLASASATLKHVTLELGGNDPGIVLADADPNVIGGFVQQHVCVKRAGLHLP